MDNGLEERLVVGIEGGGGEVRIGNGGDDLKTRIWNEKKLIWRIAFPGIITRATSFGLIVVTQSFLGHVGEIELASYALVQSIFIRFVNGILVSTPHPPHPHKSLVFYFSFAFTKFVSTMELFESYKDYNSSTIIDLETT